MLLKLLQPLFPAKIQYNLTYKHLGLLANDLQPIILAADDLQTQGMECIDQLIAATSYHDCPQLQSLIKACKYKQQATLAVQLAAVLTPLVQTQVPANFTLCPVPMHWWYQWHRGFNQAEVLCATVARQTKHQIFKGLKRKFTWGHQARRNRSERLQALQDKFYCTDKPPSSICLIDDVCTTGATLNECAKVLRQCGAKQVIACTLSRSEYR